MEANAVDSKLTAQPREGQRHRVGSPRLDAALVIGKQVSLRFENDTAELGSARHRRTMPRDAARALLSCPSPTRCGGPGASSSPSRRSCAQPSRRPTAGSEALRADHSDRSPQPAELTTSRSSDHRKMQQHSELRIATSGRTNDQLPDLLRCRRSRRRLPQPWR